MDLRNLREIKKFAAQRLEQSPSQQQIVLIYAGLALGMTALMTVLNCSQQLLDVSFAIYVLSYWVAGNRMVTRVPPPSAFSRVSVPPCISTISSQTARPMPEPRALELPL